jgi:hypothetical protein
MPGRMAGTALSLVFIHFLARTRTRTRASQCELWEHSRAALSGGQASTNVERSRSSESASTNVARSPPQRLSFANPRF